jgi:hypothetical protein
MNSRLQATGDRQQPEPESGAPRSASRKDPVLLVLLPVACSLWVIALALGVIALVTTAHASTVNWEQERAEFTYSLDAAVFDTTSRDEQVKAFEALRARAEPRARVSDPSPEPVGRKAKWNLQLAGAKPCSLTTSTPQSVTSASTS